MLHEGISFETIIRRIRVSQARLHDVNGLNSEGSPSCFTVPDLLTDIFTENFPSPSQERLRNQGFHREMGQDERYIHQWRCG